MGCSWELQAGPPAALGAFRANPSQWKSAGTILPSGSIALRLTYLGWQRPLSPWLGTQWEVIMVVPTTRANPEWMVGCSVVSPWIADLADLLTVPVSTYVARVHPATVSSGTAPRSNLGPAAPQRVSMAKIIPRACVSLTMAEMELTLANIVPGAPTAF